jgi:hypothetical protein
MTDLAMAKADKAISLAQRRAERIRLGMYNFIVTRREIAAAYAERDWVTLGYASFDAYVDSEFGEDRLRLSPEERREAVAELRLTGMSQRAIGSALGVDQKTVSNDLRAGEENSSPAAITGTDGKTYASTRPTPTPGPVDAADCPPADPGTTPAPAVVESPALAAPQEPDPTPEHDAAEAWKGTEPGSCGVECVCGVVFDGFDTLAEATQELKHHIKTPEPDAVSTAPSGPGPAEVAPTGGAGTTSAPVTPPPGSPATWTDEQREANRLEVERKAAIAACERVADSLVLEIRGMVTTIIDGLDNGAPGIPVSLADIDECRAALDRLEARVINA